MSRWQALAFVSLACVALVGCDRIFSFNPADVRLDAGPDAASDGAHDADGAYDGDVSIRVEVVPQFRNFANWNSYLLPGNTATSCPIDSDTETRLDTCIHGGQRRQVTLAGYDSCEDLTLKEELGLFAWDCNGADGNGPVVFSTTGFVKGKGLADLLRPESFQENSVTIHRTSDNVQVAHSESTIWHWANKVIPLPSALDRPALLLDRKNTIYTLAESRSENGYNINADGIAIVTLGDAELTFAGASPNCDGASGELEGNERCLIAAGSTSFLWIEAKLDGNGADRGIILSNVTFSRIHNTTVKEVGRGSPPRTDASIPKASVALRKNSRSNVLTDLTVSSSGVVGVYIQGYDNLLRDIAVDQVADNGISVPDSGDRNTFNKIRVTRISAEGRSAIFVQGDDNQLFNIAAHKSRWYGLSLSGNRNVVVNATLTNHTKGGFRLWADDDNPETAEPEGNVVVGVLASHNQFGGYLQTGDATTVSHVTAVNNALTGIRTGSTGSTNRRSTLNQIVTVNNLRYGLNIVGDEQSGEHLFSRVVAAHNHVVNIKLATGIHSFVGDLSVSGLPGCEVAMAGRGLINGICTNDGSLRIVDLSQAFVGKVGDQGLPAHERFGLADDSINNRWLVWSNDGVLFPDITDPVTCDTCRLWDWRLSSLDSPIRGVNGELVPGDPCPDAAHGSQALDDKQKPPRTFLVNATEIVGDGEGNDNGLCESNERCVFSPNLGAYQGHGALIGPCQFDGDRVAGVKLYAYSDNGG